MGNEAENKTKATSAIRKAVEEEVNMCEIVPRTQVEIPGLDMTTEKEEGRDALNDVTSGIPKWGR